MNRKPEIVTEQTPKIWKAIQAAGLIAFFVGFGIAFQWGDRFLTLSMVFMSLGLAAWIGGKSLAWWRHG